MAAPVRFGVWGVDHPHVVSLTSGLLDAGAQCVGWGLDHDDPGGLFAACFPALDQRAADDVLGDEPDLMVLAGVPVHRTPHAIASMEAGADVVVAKPAAITSAQLAEIEASVAATHKRWWVAFTEHFLSRAMLRADALVADGRIGTVRHVVGLGPHRLGGNRPEWFWEQDQAGSTLVDLVTHQLHHVTRYLGTTDVEVTAAHLAPDNAVAEVLVRGGTGTGYTRVDWLAPDGLPTWGDVRLFITGDSGTIEVRPNIDPGGRPGLDHLILTDREAVTVLDCGDDPLPWASDMVTDVGAGTESVVSTASSVEVTRLCLQADDIAAATHP